jgi:enamine deaminase RidA (YjgF/YER057c/UK114 family)
MRERLAGCALSPSDALMMRLYVANLGEYAAVNAAYSAFFGDSTPAARLAVQLPLAAGCGSGCRVVVEALAWAGPKQLLHVQSLSEWAPRMIGPYCQLTIGGGVCHVAGSLGLVPASMTLVPGGAVEQAELALRNCAAVLEGLSKSAQSALSLVLYFVRAEDAAGVHAVALRWLRRVTGRRDASISELPPVLMLQVGALPMSALVEAHLEALASSETPLFRAAWQEAAGSVTTSCDVVVAGAAAPQETPPNADGAVRAVSGTATVLIGAEQDVPLGHACSAASAAVVRLKHDLASHAPPLLLDSAIYARVLYEDALGLEAPALGRAMSDAINRMESFECAVVALPVQRVVGGGGCERIALQLHFTASLHAEPEDA